MSRLKSSSSSKSERAIVSSVHAVLAMASVDRSERSKIAISPKHAPGFSTARASSPDPGIVREILTSPSRIRNNRLPGSPSLNTYCATANFCSRHTSATRASSPSSRSWKMAACLSRLRSTRRSYDAREGGASETVGDVGGSAYGASGSSGRGVPVRDIARVAAGARGRAAASDFFDGMLARRFGSSRVGAVLDPIADKLFMAAAFLTVARSGLLHPLEIVAVLARDIVAALGYAGSWLLRRPTALPARAGGKVVTVLQLLTLAACITASPLARRLAWATAGVGLYAIWDYGRAAARSRAQRAQRAHGRRGAQRHIGGV